MNKTIIYIDAGFLSKLSYVLGNGVYLTYDIGKFAELISNKENLKLEKILYYTAPPFISGKKTGDELKRKKNYDKFKFKLLLNSKIEVKEGRCQRIKLDDGSFEYNQKGVDTLLTIDLMSVPLKNKNIKEVILIACDSDFVPVIAQLKKYDIKVILYTYYEKGRRKTLSTSNQLIQSVSKYVLIKKEDFINSSFKNKK